MHITIIAPGSRGDVQPYLALGKGLAAAGHAVRLLTHENFEGLVNGHGLEFWPIKGTVDDIAQDMAMSGLLESGNFIAILSRMAREARQGAERMAEGGLAACAGADMLLAGMGGLYIGLSLAEKLNLRLVQAHLVPFTPTQAFPSVLLPKALSRLGGRFNRLSHHLTRQLMWQGFRSADRLARQKVLALSAPPFWGAYGSRHTQRLPILYGFSPSVIPMPSDWDGQVHVTGYWFLDTAATWQPPPKLEEFLRSGPAPVYVGFGSISDRRPEKTADLVLEALERSKQRAIMLSGWGGLRKAELPETVFMVDAIPHAWLFPRVAAVVHHGGAGTTAAGLRAGVPAIIIPFFGDQRFWGQRVADLGAGPEPIPRRRLTVDRLAGALQAAVSQPVMRHSAANLGAQIRSEDGIGRAVAIVETIAESAPA